MQRRMRCLGERSLQEHTQRAANRPPHNLRCYRKKGQSESGIKFLPPATGPQGPTLPPKSRRGSPDTIGASPPSEQARASTRCCCGDRESARSIGPTGRSALAHRSWSQGQDLSPERCQIGSMSILEPHKEDRTVAGSFGSATCLTRHNRAQPQRMWHSRPEHCCADHL